MKNLDLSTVIQEAISRFNQHRVGVKPPVFVTLSPVLERVPWQNHTAEDFVRRFLYQTLLASDPDAAIEVSLRRRSCLNDLNDFIGIQPSYWIQLRVTGRGLRIAEYFVEELFDELGFRVEEWVGIDGSDARLGIFGTIDAPQVKMIFCLESVRHKQRCDLMLPITDSPPVAALAGRPIVSQRVPA